MSIITQLRSMFKRTPRINLESCIQTSVTLGYQADRWGVERIALDGVQNHLPADSKGTRVDVDFLVNDEWILRAAYRDGTISAIRFSDDGKGYSHELLGIFHSTKKDDAEAVGYFGEGLKMLSAACLREGVNLELRSRDWRARPVAHDINIDGEEIQRLGYAMDSSERIKGSQSIFWNPSPELVDYVRYLDRKVLLLREGFTPLYRSGKRAIIDDAGDIFVKDIYISSLFAERLLFSYSLDVVPNRDRDNIHEYNLTQELERIWRTCDETEPIKRLLQAAESDSEKFASSHEACVLSNLSRHLPAEAWKRAFAELYGENAVLGTQDNVRPIVESLGYRVVPVENAILSRVLKDQGIKIDVETMEIGDNLLYLSESFDPHVVRKDVKRTSLTLDYRASKWGALRIALDAVANHMPSDSSGSAVKIEYLTRDGEREGFAKRWLRKIGYYDKAEAIRISDDGIGYVLDNLLLLHSRKSGEAVGQFGEGLKMLSAACLRDDTPIKFRSKDWIAMPVALPTTVGTEAVNVLGYRTVERAERVEGSATTIYNPSQELISIFQSIRDYILHFNDDMIVLHEDNNGRILSLGEKRATYVKGFYVTDNNSAFRTVLSYDLKTDNISPDRNVVDYDTLKIGIKNLLKTNKNPQVIEAILEAAKANRSEPFVEFMNLELEDKDVKALWRDSFVKVFGKNIVLAANDSSLNYEAEHIGYGLVSLGFGLDAMLMSAHVRTAREIAFESYETNQVPVDDLTEEERRNYARVPEIDAILGLDSPVEVIIYDQMQDSRGQDPGISGFWKQEVGKVYLRRNVLGSLFDTVRVYTHERGHNETQAPDPADKFRQFFEGNLAAFVLRELGDRKGDLLVDNSGFDYDRAIKEARAVVGKYHSALEGLDRQQASLAAAEAKIDEKIKTQYEDKIKELEGRLKRVEALPWYKRLFSWDKAFYS